MNTNNSGQEIENEDSQITGDRELLAPVDSEYDNDSSLKALVRDEQSIASKHLTEKLGRKPSDKEIDEWLSAHTESY